MVVYAAADAARGVCASAGENEQSERRSRAASDVLRLLATAMPKVRYGFVQYGYQRFTVVEILGEGRRRKVVQIHIGRDTNRQSARKLLASVIRCMMMESPTLEIDL